MWPPTTQYIIAYIDECIGNLSVIEGSISKCGYGLDELVEWQENTLSSYGFSYTSDHDNMVVKGCWTGNFRYFIDLDWVCPSEFSMHMDMRLYNLFSSEVRKFVRNETIEKIV